MDCIDITSIDITWVLNSYLGSAEERGEHEREHDDGESVLDDDDEQDNELCAGDEDVVGEKRGRHGDHEHHHAVHDEPGRPGGGKKCLKHLLHRRPRRREERLPEDGVPEPHHLHALLDLLLLLVDDDHQHGRDELTQRDDQVQGYDGAKHDGVGCSRKRNHPHVWLHQELTGPSWSLLLLYLWFCIFLFAGHNLGNEQCMERSSFKVLQYWTCCVS